MVVHRRCSLGIPWSYVQSLRRSSIDVAPSPVLAWGRPIEHAFPRSLDIFAGSGMVAVVVGVVVVRTVAGMAVRLSIVGLLVVVLPDILHA